MSERVARAWAWVKGPEREATPPPEWVFKPIVALAAIAVMVGLFLSPVAPLALVLWPLLAVQVYEDRYAQGLGHFWWPSAVGTVGPVMFLIYVQNRRETLSSRAGDQRPWTPEEWRGDSGAGGLPAAWYPDPLGQARLRWWDGTAWTHHVAP